MIGGQPPELHSDGESWHPCFCVVVWSSGKSSPCETPVRSHDQPFCEVCSERHPDVDREQHQVLTHPLRIPRQRVAPGKPHPRGSL